MSNVIFQLENGGAVTTAAQPGDTLLTLAREANVAIDAPCSGNGSCGKCRIRLLEGALDSLPGRHISTAEFEEGWRLACASRIGEGDITVLVPDIASAYQSRIRTADLSDASETAVFAAMKEALPAAGIGGELPYRLVVVTMEEPTLDDTLPDNERLLAALSEVLGQSEITLSAAALRQLPDALREGGFTVSCIVKTDAPKPVILGLLPGGAPEPLLAAAIDIGTTTVSGVLVRLSDGAVVAKASAGNGQIRYGADVINRIVEQSKPGGVEKLRKAITEETLVPLLQCLLQQAGAEARRVVRIAVAGNTTMEHLLLGVPADPLRKEPYIPAFFHLDPMPAQAVFPGTELTADVYLAPNIGSYVGGDITAGTMASMIWDKEEFSLFIDLGTNGELVFGNREFLMSCACSAGPAFEGGDISCGMRATDGAIEALSIDPVTFEPSYTVVGDQAPVGICGSGIIDTIAALFRTGLIDPKGRFAGACSRVLHDRHGIGRYVIATAEESATGREISMTEIDIESFIRAKGAIYSAIDTMLGTLEMDAGVIDRIYVAGGIGSGINIDNAIRIGMFPDVERERYTYIGNSSLAGAYAMACRADAAHKVREIAGNMTYLELSTFPGYMDQFVAACFLPHTDASRFPSSR